MKALIWRQKGKEPDSETTLTSTYKVRCKVNKAIQLQSIYKIFGEVSGKGALLHAAWCLVTAFIPGNSLRRGVLFLATTLGGGYLLQLKNEISDLPKATDM